MTSIILNPCGLRTFAVKKLSKLLSTIRIAEVLRGGVDDQRICLFVQLAHSVAVGKQGRGLGAERAGRFVPQYVHSQTLYPSTISRSPPHILHLMMAIAVTPLL